MYELGQGFCGDGDANDDNNGDDDGSAVISFLFFHDFFEGTLNERIILPLSCRALKEIEESLQLLIWLPLSPFQQGSARTH
jgi:hypothetical protein